MQAFARSWHWETGQRNRFALSRSAFALVLRTTGRRIKRDPEKRSETSPAGPSLFPDREQEGRSLDTNRATWSLFLRHHSSGPRPAQAQPSV